METQLSAVKHFGHIKVFGHEFVVVNKEGKDIFECSYEAERAGRQYAIDPGEPADLCRKDFVKYYRKLGRDKFIEVIKDNGEATPDELMKIYKDLTKKTK